MKILLAISIIVVMVGMTQANCGNDKSVGNGYGCPEKGDKGKDGKDGKAGPQGDVGPQGPSGNDGVNGNDGLDGKNGVDAKPSNDMEHRLSVNVGASVRWYDWKNVSLLSGYKFDTNHQGHTVDALVIQIKLGKSYEERQIDKLLQDIKLLKSAAHNPKEQNLLFVPIGR
jgi:hypothetical protein